MKRLILASVCVILTGYVIGEVVSHSDPAVYNALAGLTYEEINQDTASFAVAGGD